MSGKPAARLGDPTACPLPGHGSNPIAAGSPDVLFDGLPAARMGDASVCGGAMSGNVIANVLINGKPAAVLGSVGSHGNVVVGGSGTVLIGTAHSPATFIAPPPVLVSGQFDEHFVILDATTKAPLANQRYRLETASGKVIVGMTDANGKTERITSSQAESVTLVLEEQTSLVIA